MKITWIGQSCFKMEKNAFAVVIDPYAPGKVPGLKEVKEMAQLVCCSHAHADHAYTDGVEIVNGNGPAPEIQRMQVWHDEEWGALRGSNTIHIIDFNGERIVHLGDIGCDLTEQEISMLKGADVLMIPVGGHFTISLEQAIDMVKKIRPRIAIPMHYRDDKLHFGYDVIGTTEEFLKAFGENIFSEGCCIDTDDYPPENGTKVIRMIPQNI